MAGLLENAAREEAFRIHEYAKQINDGYRQQIRKLNKGQLEADEYY